MTSDRFTGRTGPRRDAESSSDKLNELETIYRTSPIGLAVITPDLRFVRINDLLAEINGLSAEEHVGRSVREVVPDLADQAEAIAREVIETGRPRLNVEITGETKSQPGVRRTWVESWTPVCDASGRITAINIVAQDVTEARTAEAGRRRLLQLLERSEDFVALADAHGMLTYMNGAGRRMIGVDDETDISSLSFEDYVAPHSLAFFRDTVIPTARELGIWRGEMQLANVKTGAIIDVFRSTFRIAEPDGAYCGFGTVTRDITEEKRTAARLAESERLFRATFEQAAIGVAHVGLDGRWLRVNERLCEMLGYSRAELLARTFQEITYPDDLAKDVANVQALLDGKSQTYSIEKRYIRSDASLLWCRLTVSLLRDDAGRPLNFVAVIEDISANKAAEAALRESAFFTEQIANIAPSILYIYDLIEKRNVWGNRSMVTTLGYSFEEIAGLSGSLIDKLMHPDDAAAYARHLARVLALRDGETAEFEYRFKRPDGSWMWLHSSDAVFRRDEEGRPTQIIGAAIDITRRREADAVLARGKAELEKLVEERTAALMREVDERRAAEEALRQSEKLQLIGQLTGGIAHDFNNVLQVVASGVHLLGSGRLSEERKASVLAGLERSTQSAAELIARLLAIGRRQSLKPEPIDVGEALQGMAELLRRTLGSAIQLEVRVPPDLWFASIDRSQFEMAILNLAMNARDAMPGGGALSLRGENRPGAAGGSPRVCVTVEDSGLGMPADVLKHAFEPFFTTKSEGKGTGLGLPQVYGFAKQSGGDVEIDSEPGAGTRVSLLLPRLDAAPAKQGKGAAPGGPTPRSSGRVVLVVDDNPEVAAFAAAMLEGMGYTALRAESGAEALAILGSGRRVDALFSDIVMPGLSGAELATIVRERYPKIAIVLATGYSEQRSALGQSVEVLDKPYRQNDLGRALERGDFRTG